MKISWETGRSGDWADAVNWNPIVVPSLADDVEILNAMTRTTTISGTASAHWLEVHFGSVNISGSLTISTTLLLDANFYLEGGALTAQTIIGGETYSSIEGYGTVNASFVGSTLLVARGGLLKIEGSLGDSQGLLEVLAGQQGLPGAALELSSATSRPVMFFGGGSTFRTLILDQPASYTGQISQFSTFDALDLKGITASSISYDGSTLTVNQANGQHLTYALSGSVSDRTLTFASDNSGGTVIYGGVLPSVSVAAVVATSVKENDSGLSPVAFQVTRSGNVSISHSVAYSVQGVGDNAVDAADFAGGVLPHGTVTFAPFETTKTFIVNVRGDTLVEPNENFAVVLSNPTAGLQIGTATASGTIANDDLDAHDDAYVLLRGQQLTIAAPAGVLVNDVAEATMTAIVKTAPAHGTLQLNADGTFTYTPTASFTGVDSFAYRATATDGGADDARALLYVVPVNVGATTTLGLTALTPEEQIASTYVAFFGRAPDAAGFAFWVDQFVMGLPVQGPSALFANIASSFGISNEAKGLYPFLANPFGASNAYVISFLDSVYNNLFNRSADSAGLDYWAGQIRATLAAGKFVGSVLVDIMSGAQNTAAGKDITTLMNKVAVGLEYASQQQQHHTPWAGVSDLLAATDLLHVVTADPATVVVGIRHADDLIAAHG